MDSRRDTRRQEVAQLQLQLANASRLLDEIEKRSSARRQNRNAPIDKTVELISENAANKICGLCSIWHVKNWARLMLLEASECSSQQLRPVVSLPDRRNA